MGGGGRLRQIMIRCTFICNLYYSSTCHERTLSGPGKSVRTLQVAARDRDGWAGGGGGISQKGTNNGRHFEKIIMELQMFCTIFP